MRNLVPTGMIGHAADAGEYVKTCERLRKNFACTEQMVQLVILG